MQYCGNEVGQKFLENLAKEMAEWNVMNEHDPDVNSVPVPFYIAALWNQFKFHSEKYTEFFEDVKDEGFYQIVPSEYGDSYCVTLWEKIDTGKWYNDLDCKNYHYEIHFPYEERYWGYCECMPGDEGYDERRLCCGHGCDWNAPVVTVYKCYDVDYGEWNGDEHDYWDFEDAFYKDDLELKARIEEEAKQQRIKDLERQIASYQDDLMKLKKEMEDK